MSRKKKKKNIAPQASTPVLPASSSPSLPTPDAFSRQMSFDSLEDRIRGEEMLQDQEQKKLKEAQDIKKKLESVEVDRRMEELRKQLGLRRPIPQEKKLTQTQRGLRS